MDPINSSRFCRSLVRDLTNDAKNLGHDTERLSLAMTYSACYHAGMLRKSGEPYILHPLLVARGVQIMGGQQADVLAAVQHDVVEDCVGVSLADVEIELGADVAARVAPLTKDYRLPTSQLRVSDSFGRLCMAMSQIGRGVGLVKIMDRAHNAATSRVLTSQKIDQMREENHCMFAPLARFIGAKGLANFLVSRPEQWWQVAPHFLESMAMIQPRLLLV